MRDLEWSSDLKETVIVQDSLTAEEALDILSRVLLGDDYNPMDGDSDEEYNAIIVRDILTQYKPKRKKIW